MFGIARKEVSGDGRCEKLFYYNGDIKETNKDAGIVKYLYSHTQTWHNTYQDGREELIFKNGQEEVNKTDKCYIFFHTYYRAASQMGLCPYHFPMVQQRPFHQKVKKL